MKKIRKILRIILTGLFISLTTYYFYPDTKIAENIKIDQIIVFKSQRLLIVYSEKKLIKKYKISIGLNAVGPKEFEGDKKTPEGLYTINDKNPNSGYHKNLGISYPNEKDIENAKKICKPTGGNIKIHGMRNGLGLIGKFHRWFDWTLGCIALTNREVDELYDHTPIGTPIEIKP